MPTAENWMMYFRARAKGTSTSYVINLMARERLVYALLLRGTAGRRAADRSTAPTRETRSCGIAVLWGECGHPTTPVPIVNLIRWRGRPNWAMFLPDVGRLQIDLVAAVRVIPIESNA